MVDQKCMACGEGILKKASLSGFKGTLHPYKEQEWQTNWKGVSKVFVTVCPECGYVSLNAEKPDLFKNS